MDAQHMLTVERVEQFYGGSHILRGVSLVARRGEITVVLGRNGVGKSTLLRTIVGLTPIRSGSIALEGVPIHGKPPFERARLGIGYVPQGREIFGRLTVEENLQMGLAPCPARTAPREELFELFPVLRKMLKRRGGDLSGGQQQQLAIARALAADPKVLILDEPTEGIQPNVIKDIGRVLKLLAARGRMAIVLVEQYYDFAAELADAYAVMERGEIVRSGRGADMVRDGVRELLAL